MADEREPLLSIKKMNHRFRFWVNDNGTVEYTVNGEEKHIIAKELKDGKVFFKETLELFVNDDVIFYESLPLDDLEFATLKTEQNLKSSEFKKRRDEVRVLTLVGKTKKELLSMVDKWQKQVKTLTKREGKTKTKEKYTIHTFTIGKQHFRMIERVIDGEVIINPDYKVFTDFPCAGGIASKEGELVVWKYYFEKEENSEIDPTRKKGFWETARKLTFNEEICYEIIKRYGTFSEKEVNV